MKTNPNSHVPIHNADDTEGIPSEINLKSHDKDGRDGTFRPLLAITAAVLCTSLCSCVMQDDGYGRNSATFTSYQPGHMVRALPAGYHSEVILGNTYYYQSGNYYRRSTGGYVVIDAPRTSRYYHEYGRLRQVQQVDYRNDRKTYDRHDQRYERGDILVQMPAGYRVVNHRGRQYFQVGERYYIRDNGAYAAVSRPF